MGKAKTIHISFKSTKKDQELYNLLINLEDRSQVIKEILREDLIKNTKE